MYPVQRMKNETQDSVPPCQVKVPH